MKQKLFTIISVFYFFFLFSLEVHAKPIFWGGFSEYLEETKEELPLKLNDLTTLTKLEVNKRQKKLIFTYNIDVEHIKRLDIDYIKRTMLGSDCMKVNEKNFDSPVKVIHHHYIAKDGSDGFFEMTEKECREGLQTGVRSPELLSQRRHGNLYRTVRPPGVQAAPYQQ